MKSLIRNKSKQKNKNYYQKHKTKKQLKLNLQKGSGKPITIDNYKTQLLIGSQTLAECIKELIEVSYNLYNEILQSGISSTIICGGQSPSYYCLAMMHFKIFNHEIVNIVILPHSKGGMLSNQKKKYNEDKEYCQRINEKYKEGDIRQNSIIIDGVHSGVGILALERALKYCIPRINITKIAINYRIGISKIKVDREIALPCEPLFSDTFPRLVVPYHPENFDNSTKFITEFHIDKNPIAEMIIDIAKEYPNVRVEETEWFKLNKEITPEFEKRKEEQKQLELEKAKRMEKQKLRELEKAERDKQNEQLIKQYKIDDTHFIPIVLKNTKGNDIYKCPVCNKISGTDAPKKPSDTSLFSHNVYCPFKNKIPQEQKISN